MKKLVVSLLIVVTVFIITPIKSYATDQVETIWDNSTKFDPLIPNNFDNLTIKSGTFINPPDPITVTINGTIKTEPGAIIKLTNINFVIDSDPTEQSIIANLDLTGSIIVKNGNFDLTKSRLQNPTGIALDIQKSDKFSISKNEITNSDIGISLSPDPIGSITNNYFTNNRIGLSINNNQVVKTNSNNFISNTEYAVQAQNFPTEIDSDLSRNWWGCPEDPLNSENILCEKINGNTNTSDWLTQPNYQLKKGDLSISEIMPNPSGSEECEWVEIKNNLDIDMPLSGLTIFDAINNINHKPTVLPFFILEPDNYIIVANEKCTSLLGDKKIIIIKEIGSGLNNTGEESVIINHWLALIDEASYGGSFCPGNSKDDYSCSFFPDGWQWSSIPTPGAQNQKSPPPIIIPTIVISPTPNIQPPTITTVPTCPMTAKIKDLLKYINCRVEIIAKVKRSYGSYFYIYDETGEAKVYLQASKKIKKPRLTTGLSIKVKGIIDNYRTGLRILPQTSSDIYLIPIKTPLKSSIATKSKTLATPKKTNSPDPVIDTKSPMETKITNDLVDQIIPPVKASVKGVVANQIKPSSSHLALKLALICAIMLLIAVSSYNMGLKNANKNE